jgi:predicted TIM-barrel fold metal-dependent hydrolase
MNILDTHQHLWELDRFRYSWCEQIPQLNRSFTLRDYAAAATGTGIVRSLFVEADVDESFMASEAEWALSLSEARSSSSVPLAGVVAAVRPESAEFARQLECILGHAALKGVRRILHTEPDALSADRVFRENVRLLGGYALSFDICVLDRQLPLAIELVDSCPGVSFILDHAGNPAIGETRMESWRANMITLAERDNVACKISGLTPRSGTLPTTDHFRQVIEHVIECFGCDRVMFGSDWPLCTLTSSLREWVDLVFDLTKPFGVENQYKLFSENAERIYRCSGDNQ